MGRFSTLVMGKPNPSKPVSNDQKMMSDHHKETRQHLDEMNDGFTNKETLLRAGIKYDDSHERDHRKAGKHARKMLADHMRGKLAHQFIHGTKILKD